MAEDGEEERRKFVRNERFKLASTFLNTLASGSMLAGVVIPVASIVAGLTPVGVTISTPRLLLSSLIWLVIGIALHWMAQRLLEALEP